MKTSTNIVPFFATVLSATLLVGSMSVGAAERAQMTYVKSNMKTVTKSAMTINDGSNHEVKQEVQVSDVVYSDSRFGKVHEIVYITADEVDGNGPHRGHFVDTHSDGWQCYGDFEGSTRTIMKADGSWTASWEGTYRYLGGSGICRNLRGSGKYSGGASSTQTPHEEGTEVREF